MGLSEALTPTPKPGDEIQAFPGTDRMPETFLVGVGRATLDQWHGLHGLSGNRHVPTDMINTYSGGH